MYPEDRGLFLTFHLKYEVSYMCIFKKNLQIGNISNRKALQLKLTTASLVSLNIYYLLKITISVQVSTLKPMKYMNTHQISV